MIDYDLNEPRVGIASPEGSRGISIFFTAEIALPGTEEC